MDSSPAPSTPPNRISSTDQSYQPSPASEQARLRRERRNAKLLSSGASRLAAITSLTSGHASTHKQSNGTPPDPRSFPEPESSGSVTRRSPEPDTSTESDSTRSPGLKQPLQPELRAPQDTSQASLLEKLTALQTDPSSLQDSNPLSGLPTGLMELLEAVSQGPGGASGAMPPTMANQQPSNQTAISAAKWRATHAVMSLTTGALLLVFGDFSGSIRDRYPKKLEDSNEFGAGSTLQTTFAEVPINAGTLLGAFLTLELVLQSSRILIQRRSHPDESGLLFMLARMLPEPYRSIVINVAAYNFIYNTLVNDVMCIIFVLGCGAWWFGNAS